MIHAFTQRATPALRAWLDNNSGAVDDVAGRYQRVNDALHGRTTISEPLPLSDWKDIDGVWRALLLDADVNPQIVVDTLIVPVALAARGRGGNAVNADAAEVGVHYARAYSRRGLEAALAS